MGLPPLRLNLSGAVPALVAPQHDMRGLLASATSGALRLARIAKTPPLRPGMDPGRKHP